MVHVRTLAAASLVAALSAAAAASAMAWPDKPVRLVVVGNQPGAGGTIGALDVLRAAPGGYTLMLSNSTPTSIGPFTVPKPPYDPVKPFSHIAMLGLAPVPLMANPQSGLATLKDLPKAATVPGFAVGSGGPGSIGLPPEAVDKLAKTPATIVADPAVIKRFEDLGITPGHQSPAEFSAFVARQVADWAPAIKAADLKP